MKIKCLGRKTWQTLTRIDKMNKALKKKMLSENEQHMGEMAAYHVACEQLGIDPDDGWELLAEDGDE